MNKKDSRKACEFCQIRKIRCDRARPRCTSCQTHKRQCVYQCHIPKPRPSNAAIKSLESERDRMITTLARLRDASPEERQRILDSDSQNFDSSTTHMVNSQSHDSDKPEPVSLEVPEKGKVIDQKVDLSCFLSCDDDGQVKAYGPASSLYRNSRRMTCSNNSRANCKDQLIANAALQRQREYQISLLPEIAGVPSELATHLLDLHWNRQHHTFLLTYRPLLTNDLLEHGPYASDFLLNAIFACASKYSDRLELRDDITDSRTAGGRFFKSCDEYLAQNPPAGKSSLATVAGLLLLGSTYVANGEVSKGWLCSGLAFRMVFDLGLHITYTQPGQNQIELEARRRLFWGAYVCDKLQSLYTGRPAAINLRHCCVSRDLVDTFEEGELWTPYIDFNNVSHLSRAWTPIPIYSVSTFQKLCDLSDIMIRVIDSIYSIGAHEYMTTAKLQSLENDLQTWENNLPQNLQCRPWAEEQSLSTFVSTPNVLILNALYHSLRILLYRPFLSDGHLRSRCHPKRSWNECTEAATSIAGILDLYRRDHTFRRGPYVLSYAAYVACTIHVRNSSLEDASGPSRQLLRTTMAALDQLTIANRGVLVPLEIIKSLLQKYKVTCPEEDTSMLGQSSTAQNCQTLPHIGEEYIFQMFDGPEQLQCISRSQMNSLHDNVADIGSVTVDFQDDLFGYLLQEEVEVPFAEEAIFCSDLGLGR